MLTEALARRRVVDVRAGLEATVFWALHRHWFRIHVLHQPVIVVLAAGSPGSTTSAFGRYGRRDS